MKNLLLGITLTVLAASTFAADVGVSISVGQPGFYGRIDIGNMPQPRLIYAEPMIVQTAPYSSVRQPIYLRVPPGHEKHWDKNCRKYNACNQRVYFVQDNWYLNDYAPAYRSEHGNVGKANGHGKKKKKHGKD